MLSGRSDLMDFLEPCRLSSGDAESELKDETVLLVLVRPWLEMTFLFICSMYALIPCGEGGPSMEGSIVSCGEALSDGGSTDDMVAEVLGRRAPSVRNEAIIPVDVRG